MADNHTETTNTLLYGGKNIFEKEYTDIIKELGIKAKIKLHYPTVLEEAKIKARMSELFEGQPVDFVTSATYEMLLMLKYLDEGSKVWRITETEDGIERELIEDFLTLAHTQICHSCKLFVLTSLLGGLLFDTNVLKLDTI